MTDPYATPEPLPYDPEDPETLPVEALPEPEREHLSAEEAIARQEAVVVAAVIEEPEPPMVTTYKQNMADNEPEPN